MVVATGSVTNAALLVLFEANLGVLIDALGESNFVEPGTETMVLHRRRGEPAS